MTGQLRMMDDWCYLVTAPQFAHELPDFGICSLCFTTEPPHSAAWQIVREQ